MYKEYHAFETMCKFIKEENIKDIIKEKEQSCQR